jgi:hypothetical protein
MPDEPRLREQAREAIQTGKLPSRAPDRTWGGPGVGADCTVCGHLLEGVRGDEGYRTSSRDLGPFNVNQAVSIASGPR